MISTIIFAASIVMIASLGGVFLAWHGFKHFFERNAALFTSFAIGVFTIVTYSLFTEASHEGLSVSEMFLWGLIGAVLLEMLSRIIPHAHHHHDASHDDHAHTRLDARRMLIGDAIHNIGDGIILVPAFLIDVRFGIATTIGIFLHELTQEIAEFFVLKSAGYSTRRALIYNFLVSSTILIGVGLSLNFALSGEQLGIVFAIAAGGFLYVILRDLLPDVMHVMQCNKSYIIYPLFMLLGAAVIYSVNILVPHAHGDEGSSAHIDDHSMHEENAHHESEEIDRHSDDVLIHVEEDDHEDEEAGARSNDSLSHEEGSHTDTASH